MIGLPETAQAMILLAAACVAIVLGYQIFWNLVAMLARPRKHRYTSTACAHDYHDRCRKQCKFCLVRCVCSCHRKE